MEIRKPWRNMKLINSSWIYLAIYMEDIYIYIYNSNINIKSACKVKGPHYIFVT